MPYVDNNVFFDTHQDHLFRVVNEFACEGDKNPLYYVPRGQIFQIAALTRVKGGAKGSIEAIICMMKEPVLAPRPNITIVDLAVLGSGVVPTTWAPNAGSSPGNTPGFLVKYNFSGYCSTFFAPYNSGDPITATKTKTSASFPHKCKKCGSPAYYGFVKMECSKTACPGGW